MEIQLVHLNVPTNILSSLSRLIQSKKAKDRTDGLNRLLSLLKITQRNNVKSNVINLPTISNQLYNIITEIAFDQKFNDHQLRQCFAVAKNSWLLNDTHRKQLNNI